MTIPRPLRPWRSAQYTALAQDRSITRRSARRSVAAPGRPRRGAAAALTDRLARCGRHLRKRALLHFVEHDWSETMPGGGHFADDHDHLRGQSDRPADGAFRDPTLIDQLIDDRRHGAPLQTRSSCQVGARHRVMAADEVERNAAIDLARVSLVATRKLVRSILRIRFPPTSIDEVVGGLQAILLAPRTIPAPCQFCQFLGAAF
jgi:hypothetical protein